MALDSYTATLRAVWGFVSDYHAQHGRGPSPTKVGEFLGHKVFMASEGYFWWKRLADTGYVTGIGIRARVNVPLLTRQEKEVASDNPSA